MDSMPITVGDLPQGEAYEAGVREGWVLCQVGTDESNMRSLGSKMPRVKCLEELPSVPGRAIRFGAGDLCEMC